MKRKLLLAGLPFVILGSILLLVSITIGPLMIPLVYNERQNIPHSAVADRYYYVSYPVELSATQRAEFEFSSSQPLNFYIFDVGNWNRHIQNQTSSVITSSRGERESTQSFRPLEADTYVFVLLNTGPQDATVTITVRRSFFGQEYVAVGVLLFGGVLMTLAVVLKPRAVEIPTKVLEMIKMHGQVRVGELAFRFSTSETDIELTLLKLRNMNEPIFYNAATREVSYGPPRPPATSPSSSPSAQVGS